MQKLVDRDLFSSACATALWEVLPAAPACRTWLHSCATRSSDTTPVTISSHRFSSDPAACHRGADPVTRQSSSPRPHLCHCTCARSRRCSPVWPCSGAAADGGGGGWAGGSGPELAGGGCGRRAGRQELRAGASAGGGAPGGGSGRSQPRHRGRLAAAAGRRSGGAARLHPESGAPLPPPSRCSGRLGVSPWQSPEPQAKTTLSPDHSNTQLRLKTGRCAAHRAKYALAGAQARHVMVRGPVRNYHKMAAALAHRMHWTEQLDVQEQPGVSCMTHGVFPFVRLIVNSPLPGLGHAVFKVI